MKLPKLQPCNRWSFWNGQVFQYHSKSEDTCEYSQFEQNLKDILMENYLFHAPCIKTQLHDDKTPGFFSCCQAALSTVLSVRPSVYRSVPPPVCHTFFTMFPSPYHYEFFLGIIVIDRSEVHANGQGLRSGSRSQRSKQILPEFGQCQTVTPVRIHRWLRNDARRLN